MVKLGEPTVEPLIEALKDKDSYVRIDAADSLAKIGEPAVEHLIEALEGEDNTVRREAAWTLGKIGDSRVSELLNEALKDKDKGVRRLAEEALRKIGDGINKKNTTGSPRLLRGGVVTAVGIIIGILMVYGFGGYIAAMGLGLIFGGAIGFLAIVVLAIVRLFKEGKQK